MAQRQKKAVFDEIFGEVARRTGDLGNDFPVMPLEEQEAEEAAAWAEESGVADRPPVPAPAPTPPSATQPVVMPAPARTRPADAATPAAPPAVIEGGKGPLIPFMNTITDGDPPPPPPDVVPPKIVNPFMIGDVALGRPPGWPAMISWPPARLREGAKRMSDDPQERALQIATVKTYYDGMAKLMAAHCHRVAAHFEEEERRVTPKGLLERISDSLASGGAANKTFEAGFNWALLADPSTKRGGVDPAVRAWGRNFARVSDGGVVRCRKHSVGCPKPTPDAVKLMVAEAQARGWSTLKIDGTPEFCKLAAKTCMAMGMKADITARFGPDGIFPGKTVRIDPSVPRSPDLFDQMMRLAREVADKRGESNSFDGLRGLGILDDDRLEKPPSVAQLPGNVVEDSGPETAAP